MKILFILHDSPDSLGGTQVFAKSFANEIAHRNNCEVGIVWSEKNDRKGKIVIEPSRYGILRAWKIINPDYHSPNQVIRFFQKLRKLIFFRQSYNSRKMEQAVMGIVDEFKPDIVHILNLANLSISIIDALKRKKIPIVMTLVDFWYLCPNAQLFWTSRLHRPAECQARCLFEVVPRRPRKIIQNIIQPFLSWEIRRRQGYAVRELNEVDLIFAPSRILESLYREAGILPGKITFSHYGIDPILFRKNPHSLPEKIRFSYIGRITYTKGVHLISNAFRDFEEGVDISIYGGGGRDDAMYEQELKKQSVDSPLKFKGSFSNQDIATIFENTDVLIVPSLWWENSPIVIQEALTAGIPVIASDVEGIKDLVTHMENGLIFKTGDASDLQKQVKILIQDRDLLKKLTSHCFPIKDISQSAKEVIVYYDKLAHEHP